MRTILLTVALAAALALPAAARATAVNAALTVAPGKTATDHTRALPDGTAVWLSIRVNGREATRYENINRCLSYAYGGGVTLRIDSCGRAWKLRATNASSRLARITVSAQLADAPKP